MNYTSNWKEAILDGALSITEVVVSILKAIVIVGGIIGANLADTGFGTLALSFMFGGGMLNISAMTANNWLSVFVSTGTSAIQVYLWTLLSKRGIGLKHLVNFKKLPSDIQGFIIGAGIVWLFDTILDISPLSILIRGSLYEGGSWFTIVKIIVYVLVFLLCGFAEPLTANMRQMLETGNTSQKGYTSNNNKNNNNSNNNQYRNQNNHNNNNNTQNKNNQNTANRNGSGNNVSAYLAGKTQGGGNHPAPQPAGKSQNTYTRPQGKSEPTYHPIGMKQENETFSVGDEEDIDEYMAMLKNMERNGEI